MNIHVFQTMFQHADAAVLELNRSAALEGVQVTIGGKTQRVPKSQRCLLRRVNPLSKQCLLDYD